MRPRNPAKWKNYCKASEEKKEKFFNVDISFIETILAHFGSYSDEMRLVVKESNVTEILQENLVKPKLNYKLAPSFKRNLSRHVFNDKVGVRNNL